MKYRYSLRNLSTLDEPTRPQSLAITIGKLFARLKATTKPTHRLVYDDEWHRKWDHTWGAARRVGELFRSQPKLDRVVVVSDRGPKWAVKRVPVPVERAPDGPGTRGIDIIHAATLEECKRRGWRVTELGICVNKPGEHGHCNAWDGGCLRDGNGRMLSADTIHFRIQSIAEWLMTQGKLYQATSGDRGLPVNGVIVMSKYWERGNSGWSFYPGTPHVTHWHVSAYPSITGWV